MRRTSDLRRSSSVGGERYELRELIGGGRTGLVYRAFDRELQRVVALKMLRAIDADGLYRLKREFRTLSRLAHPNILPFFDLVVRDEERFFTMELIEGVDFVEAFRGRLAAGEPPDEVFGDLRTALLQLAAGLDALHRHGLLHRDVKPANVLLEEGGRLVLMDFGLATEAAPRDGSATGAAGTMGYLAPEQLAGAKAGPASDWYGAGVMLYETLTGRLPFEGRALLGMLAGEVPEALSPAELDPGTPADLDALATALLDRDPVRRPLAHEVAARIAPRALAPRAPAPEPAPHTPYTRFVGRDAELGELFAALQASREAAVTLQLHGDSGMGKSALVDEFATTARQREGALVLVARCHPQEAIPFKAIDGVIDDLTRHLASLSDDALAQLLPADIAVVRRIFPVLGRVEPIARAVDLTASDVDPGRERQRGFAALRELLRWIAAERPLVLVIDDLQWGDLDSIALLRDLVRQPSAPRILLLLVLGRESLGSRAVLRALADTEYGALPSRVLTLGPLSRDDAQRLAGDVLMTSAGGDAAQAAIIAAESQGSPLFAAELARHVATRRTQGDAAPSWPGIAEVLAARIAGLPEIARDVLELLALAGRPLGRELESHARQRAVDLRPTLALLRTQCLASAVPTPDGVATATYHDRIRAVVLATLPEARARELHRQLAAALEKAGHADPRLLVEHYEKAGELAKAAELALAAAHRAGAELAFNQAAELYARALDLGATSLPRWRIEGRAGMMLSHAGRGSEGAARFISAAASLEEVSPADERRIALRRRASELYLRSGRYAEGLGALRSALRDAGVRYPRSTSAALLSILVHRVKLRLRPLLRGRPVSEADHERLETYWAAGVGLSLFDMVRAADFQLRHAFLAYRSEEPRHRARALATEAMTLAWEGGRRNRQRSAQIQEDAIRFAATVDDPRIAMQTLVARAALAFVERRFAAALELCEQGARLSREHHVGTTWEVANLDLCAVSALACVGQMGQLRERLVVLQRRAHDRGDLYSAISLRIGFPSMAWLGADELEEARRQIATARAAAVLAPFQEYCAVFAEAQADLYAGDGRAGWQRTSDAWPRLRRAYVLRVQGVRIDLLELRARCALATASATSVPARERERLLRFVDRAAGRLAREETPYIAAPVAALRAGVAWQRGRHELAARLLQEAEAGFAALGMRMHEHAAQLYLASAGAGGSTDGVPARMRALGAVEPWRLAATLMPGFTAAEAPR